jgi:DNA processing protein
VEARGRGGVSPAAAREDWDRDELIALVALRMLPGAGDRRVVRLLRDEGSARSALSLPHSAFARALGDEAATARADPGFESRARHVLERCRDLGADVVPIGSPAYPERLHALVDPPPILFLRGDPSLLGRPTVAVVGSRAATPVGRRTGERIGQDLARAGVVVVSGMALGIDGAAHRGALRAGGGTVAVLGCGPERAYPAANRDLFREILRNGLIVTEFPPDEPAFPFNFPRRNRLIAALSFGVVVVEAGPRSGALITADHALDLGVEVFAVPGSVELEQAYGPNRLIQEGAQLVTSAAEVMQALGWPVAADAGPAAVERARGPELVRVQELLGLAPRSLDSLVDGLGLPPARVLAALTRLELTGAAVRLEEGWRAERPAGR